MTEYRAELVLNAELLLKHIKEEESARCEEEYALFAQRTVFCFEGIAIFVLRHILRWETRNYAFKISQLIGLLRHARPDEDVSILHNAERWFVLDCAREGFLVESQIDPMKNRVDVFYGGVGIVSMSLASACDRTYFIRRMAEALTCYRSSVMYSKTRQLMLQKAIREGDAYEDGEPTYGEGRRSESAALNSALDCRSKADARECERVQ